MCSQNKEKRKWPRLKKKCNTPETVNANVGVRHDCPDAASLMHDIPPGRNSCEESTVDISSNSGLMEVQSNSNLMCLQTKKKRKRSRPKKRRKATETVNTNVDLHSVTSKATAAPVRTEPLVDMIIKTFSETDPLEVEALGDRSMKMEFTAAPVEMNTSVNTSTQTITQTDSVKKLSQSQGKRMRRKRYKKNHNPLEHNDQDHVLPGGKSLRENIFPEKDLSLQPSVDICSKSELVMKQSNGDICFFSGHNVSVNNRVVNLQIANGMQLQKEDVNLAPKVSQLDLTNVKEDFLTYGKQSCSSKSANRNSMEKHDSPTKNDLVSSETKNVDTYKRKKAVKTYIRKKRKRYSYSSIHGLDCIEEEDTRHIIGDSLMTNVSVPPEGHLEQKDTEKLVEIQITVQDTYHRVSDEIPSDPKEYNMSDHDACCKHPEKTLEVETKMAEIFPSSHLEVMKGGVLDGTGTKENLPQKLQYSPERACFGHSKKKLLVLDVNGVLADIVSHPSRRKPDITVSKKAVYKRPHSDDFLRFCFERFSVGVWSSRVKKNLDMVVDRLLGDSRQNLLFCWDAKHCTTTGLKTIEDNRKPLVLKELKKLWEKLEPNLPWEKGEYNETNTLLLDDSPYKALCNPAYTAIFPYPYDHRDANDYSLGPGGDLRVYLEGLAVAENVQEYVRQHPFGQRPLSQSDPSWSFYRKVFLVKPRPRHYQVLRTL